VTAEERRRARFKFQPVFYRSSFNGEVGATARSDTFEIPAGGSAKFDDCRGLLVHRLREGASAAEKQRRQ